MDMGLQSVRRTSIRISPMGRSWPMRLGVGPGFVQRNEYVTEAWYGWQTTPWLNLKLDAQYVICPGGYTTPTNRNAFVLGVRTTVDFF